MTIRAFNLKDDIDIMISLVKNSFHYPENDSWNLSDGEITSVVDDFRMMRNLYPIFQLGGLFSPTLKAPLRGFIWEEDGQAAGLVNLSPRGLDNQTWIIGNVAVLPEHRRKGIARKLIEATIDLTRQHEIEHVILEVIADNTPAVKLYEKLGFETYNKGMQLSRDATLDPISLPVLPEGYQVVPYHVGDWEARYRLMKNITPASVQEYEPLNRTMFRKSPPIRLLRSFILTVAPMKSMSYLVRHQATDEVVARFTCYPRKKDGGINEIEIDLDPKHAILAPYLVNRCVHNTIRFSPGRDIELRIASNQVDVVQSALDAGFINRSEWYMMGMHLSQPAPEFG